MNIFTNTESTARSRLDCDNISLCIHLSLSGNNNNVLNLHMSAFPGCAFCLKPVTGRNISMLIVEVLFLQEHYKSFSIF